MLQQMSLQNKILCISFGIFLVLYYFVNDNQPAANPQKKEDQSSADTYIPPGHVLVPVQIENSEALGAVMGAFAVVDLYSEIAGHSSLIAEKVKLIRAPLNPRQFAVLVSDSLSAQIMQVKVPFSVVLQNRNSFKANLEKNLLVENEKPAVLSKAAKTTTVFTKPALKRTVQIEYFEKNRL